MIVRPEIISMVQGYISCKLQVISPDRWGQHILWWYPNVRIGHGFQGFMFAILYSKLHALCTLETGPFPTRSYFSDLVKIVYGAAIQTYEAHELAIGALLRGEAITYRGSTAI